MYKLLCKKFKCTVKKLRSILLRYNFLNTLNNLYAYYGRMTYIIFLLRMRSNCCPSNQGDKQDSSPCPQGTQSHHPNNPVPKVAPG